MKIRDLIKYKISIFPHIDSEINYSSYRFSAYLNNYNLSKNIKLTDENVEFYGIYDSSVQIKSKFCNSKQCLEESLK